MAEKRRGLKKGDVLKGKYEILRLIGEGGMSRVFMAADLELTNKQWAIKEVDRRAVDPAGRPIEQSLAGEERILSGLDHPNIVRIVDIAKTEEFVYVVMDHVPGQTLAELVREEGPQSEENVQKWMLQICDALGYLHNQEKPIIYRDMKPSNVILHPDGYVKIIDFGVSREYKDEAKKDTVAFGTEGYAPPEAYGRAQTNPASDVYTIGATMWHLLAGEAPSETPIPDVRTRNQEVGEGFAEVIIPKCTKLDRPLRYQTCEELAADLEIYDELTREYRSKQKRKVVSFAVAGVLAVVLGLSGFGMLALRDSAITEKFDHQMAVGADQVQTNQSAAEEAYQAAISYKPDDIEPYKGLIACYKVDGIFNEEEKKQFDEEYQSHLDQLQDSSRFAELSYEIGRLYWTYYSYGQSGSYEDNQDTRIKASAEYFKNAVADPNFENYQRAMTYYGIAQFSADISNAVAEGYDDKDLYEGYWNNLVDLSGRISSEQIEKVKLDSCSLVANALETYMNKFVDVVEVPRTDMDKVFKTVQQQLDSLKTTSAETEAQRKATADRLKEKVEPKITVAYSGAAVRSK